MKSEQSFGRDGSKQRHQKEEDRPNLCDCGRFLSGRIFGFFSDKEAGEHANGGLTADKQSGTAHLRHDSWW